MKTLKWLDDNIEEFILISLLCIMTIIMGTQVIARYLFNNSLTWSEELTRYLFVWMGFISISYCIKKWISIKVDQIITMLPKHWYVVVQCILNIILFIFFSYLSYHAFHYVQASIASKQVSPALGLPMYVVHVAPFVGFTMAALRASQQILFELHNINLLLRKEAIKIGKE